MKMINESLLEAIHNEERANKSEITFADWYGKDLTGQTYEGDLAIGESSITSLKGCPKKVTGAFIVSNCFKLTSLKNGPEQAAELFISDCAKLSDLRGMPELSNGYLSISNCRDFDSFDGAVGSIREMHISFCPSLSNLMGLKEGVIHIDLSNTGISNLKGCPDTVRIIDATELDQDGAISSLKGCPRELDSLSVYGHRLTSLEGGPEAVIGKSGPNGSPAFDVRYNKLGTLKGGPVKIKGFYAVGGNPLISLNGLPANFPAKRLYELDKEEYADVLMKFYGFDF